MGKDLQDKWLKIAVWLDMAIQSIRKDYRKAPEEIKPTLFEALKHLQKAELIIYEASEEARRIPDNYQYL